MAAQARLMAFVATTDPDAAREFYGKVIELELMADEPTALVFDLGGTMLTGSNVARFDPLPFTVLGWDVKDIQAEVDRLSERGALFEAFEGFGQDENGLVTFPDGAQVAWFKDPAGNLLRLAEFSE